MKVARRLALAGLVTLGCAGSRRAGDGPSRSQPEAGVVPATASDASVVSTRALPELDAIASRRDRVAPGMRELARLDPAPPRSGDLLAAVVADTCVRVVFEADRPVRVSLEGAGGRPRGEPVEGELGAVPPRGPVCAAKGEPLHLVVTSEASAARVRAIVWAAP